MDIREMVLFVPAEMALHNAPLDAHAGVIVMDTHEYALEIVTHCRLAERRSEADADGVGRLASAAKGARWRGARVRAGWDPAPHAVRP